MSDAKSPQTPSTEEIIASIGRILAEDGGDAADAEDVLDLTEAVSEDGSVRRIEPATRHAGPVSAAPPTPAETGPRLAASEPPRRDVAGPIADRRFSGGRLLSEATAQTAAAALARLGADPPGRGTAAGPSVGAGRTLEELVHEALRPLLQRWLDDHLPAIVERLVREEIARVAGAAGRR